MKKFILPFFLVASFILNAQMPATPDKIYGPLFVDVQMARIFPDGKTFVDCIPKRDPKLIVADYLKIKNNPAIKFSLKMFVEENFELPREPQLNYVTKEKDIAMHVKNLWGVLKREPDKHIKGSSLLPLPYPYIVPGGRFREIYYWDSYFTMLGLKESGQTVMIENMLKNFAYLIRTYGHIPNGNRTYYVSRSQPPYFAKMVELLASIKGNAVYKTFLPVLEKEYAFWMKGSSTLKPGKAYKYVVKLKDGTILNRNWDESNSPRQESYREDVETAEEAVKYMLAVSLFKDGAQAERASDSLRKAMYRHLRSGATSGMDFCSRWFADGQKLTTIRTTDIIPVDLNSLLFNLEKTLARAYRLQKNTSKANYYENLAAKRKKAINKYFWSPEDGFYVDYDMETGERLHELTLAGMAPLFFNAADKKNIAAVKSVIEKHFLKDGGLLTSLKNTGQQWDAPNGWAPLEWLAITGLDNYGEKEFAKDIASRWVKLNVRVFENTGKLMEKYNVEDIHLEAGGGEYPSQDGFGWTNGVLLALMKKYQLVQ